MRTRKPHFALLWLLLALVAHLTVHCGAEDAPARPAEVAAATINWVTWDISSQAERTLVEQFREQYPQVEFKRRNLNSSWQTLWRDTPLPDLGYQRDLRVNTR